jgi:formylglycine-generating enzyme required for sulfatase activity
LKVSGPRQHRSPHFESLTLRTVFLSSTGRDLQKYRDAVHAALSALDGWKCIRMEDFTARAGRTAADFCRENAGQADLFIGLVGHCYGSTPPNSETSYTQQEYEAAAGGPRLMFVAPDNFPVPANLLRDEPAGHGGKQVSFREIASRDGLPGRPDSYDSPEKLATAVLAALRNWEQEQDAPSAAPVAGLSIGVEPWDLPSCAVFKDVGAPWCPTMVVVPSGEFVMGSPDTDADAYDEEKPTHRVAIGYRFAIGRFPVTFEEYDHFCQVTARERPGDQGWGRGRRPVINVCWKDAQDYVAWLSKATRPTYRLPSEAEWEYACRAGTTTRFSCGERITQKHANYGHTESGDTFARTSIVGAFPANPWGLYDMHGNVWEHVEDAYHDNYVGAPDNGSAWVISSNLDDRVVRGGSFSYLAKDNRSAVRCFHPAGTPDVQHGFRVVRVLTGS